MAQKPDQCSSAVERDCWWVGWPAASSWVLASEEANTVVEEEVVQRPDPHSSTRPVFSRGDDMPWQQEPAPAVGSSPDGNVEETETGQQAELQAPWRTSEPIEIYAMLDRDGQM